MIVIQLFLCAETAVQDVNELSTIMPTPNTSDVREITFKEKPMAVIPIMARTTEHTIEIPMIAAAFTSRKTATKLP